MHVTLLGGTETAPWARRLFDLLDDDDHLTVVAATGRDAYAHGLKHSPALDAFVRVLATTPVGASTYGVSDALAALGAGSAWLRPDDVEVALAVIRTELLTQGYTLTEVTAALAARHGLTATVLPMSDERIELHAVVRSGDDSRAVHVEELLASRRRAEHLAVVSADPAAGAAATQAALAAIRDADVVVVGPASTPLTVLPLLSARGIGEALAARAGVGRVEPLEPVAELVPLASELAFLDIPALPTEPAAALAAARTLS